MKYPVPCECGQVHRVAATLAGSQLSCVCGREVAVPSLSRLKASAGEAPLSAELRIEHMLQLGMLPEETTCLVCRAATSNVFHCWATCEQKQVKAGWAWGWWFLVVLLVLIFSLIVAVIVLVYLFRRSEGPTEQGRDVGFRLPLRVCERCTPRLQDYATLKETVWSVPVYRELIGKYPDTALAFDAERKGVTL